MTNQLTETIHLGTEGNTYVEMLSYVPWGLRKRIEIQVSKSVKDVNPETIKKIQQAKTPEERVELAAGEINKTIGVDQLFEMNLMMTKGLIKKAVFRGEEMDVEAFLEIIPEADFQVVFDRVTELSKPLSPAEKKSSLPQPEKPTK